jgi:menaquinone-9 beta-reductase
MPQSDVLVVGAGPAGAWVAYRLARAGARVTLFDHSHPREKACGGGLTGRAVALVADVVTAGSVAGVPVESLQFETATASVRMRLPEAGLTPESALVVTDRRTFDGELLAAAVGAGAVHVADRVREVECGERPRAVTRGGTWSADWIIGADGPNSLVRRRLQQPFSRSQLSLAAGFFIHGTSSSEVRIRAVANPPGYIWSFPRRTHLAVGICAQASVTDVDTLRRIVREWIDRSGLAGPGTRLEPYCWPIPSLPSQNFAAERPGRGRVLLVGDAAGLVDPLTREGIYYALQSANLAAEALVREGGDAATRYGARVRSDIHPELARAADLKARFFTSGFADLLVSGLARSAAVRSVMVDLVAGEQPYRTLKRRLLRTFEVKLALQLLWLQVQGQWTGRSRSCPVPQPRG